MPLNVISNFAANVAHRNLGISDAAATTSLAKLSSGTRVVSAKDDAASMAIGSRLEAERTGLQQALVNAGQAVSMLQIADGAMAKVNDILVRMKSLAVQAGSGSLSGTERSMLNTEYQALVSEVDRIANDTEFAGTILVNGAIVSDTTSATAFAPAQGIQAITFVGDHSTASNAPISYDHTNSAFSISVVDGTATNIFTGSIGSGTNDGTNMTTGTVVTLTNTATSNKIDLALNTAFVVNASHAAGTLGLSGTSATSFTFKVGTGTSSTADELIATISSVSASSLGVSTTSVSTKTDADLSSVAVSNAIDNLQDHRATIGANQNRLEFASANLATAVENTEAARSQLLDLDIASEMSNFVSKQILIQAGVAMLSQANQLPNNLLRLFQ
jgi:flagellin